MRDNLKPTTGRVKQVGKHIIQKADRGLYVIARDVSFKESVSSVSILAFIVEVSIAIYIGWNSTHNEQG